MNPELGVVSRALILFGVDVVVLQVDVRAVGDVVLGPPLGGVEAGGLPAVAAAAAAARGFVDFGYDGNPIHYPYAYPDVSLVHSWHHHSSLHHQHQHQMAPPGISNFVL